MLDHGLNARQMALIKALLKPFAPSIEKVCVFGSRATGRYRPNSDIDLVLYGSVDKATLDRLWTLFDESSLPFSVDVTAYHLLTYPPLKAHIDEAARLLFSQSDLMTTEPL